MATRREKCWTYTARYPQQHQCTLKKSNDLKDEQWCDIAGKYWYGKNSRQVQIALGVPYSRETTCRFRTGQAMRYRGENRSYITTAIRKTLHLGAPIEIARDEVKSYYRGSMSRIDGPCHTRCMKDHTEDVEFKSAWKARGQTVRAGGLPAEELSSPFEVAPNFVRSWGGRGGYYHRHSGPALTNLFDDEDGNPGRRELICVWYSRGYAHRAGGPSYEHRAGGPSEHRAGDPNYNDNTDKAFRWYRYGAEYEL